MRNIIFVSILLLASSVYAQSGKLNLAELSAKDTASFETYSRRLSIVQDSINATQKAIEGVKSNASASAPALAPKGEFEKQSEYDARKAKHEKDISDKMQRDIKPMADRLSELEKAKKKIEENQASLYGSVDIKSNPAAASIWIGKDEIGSTPGEYKFLIPGIVKIRLQKEGYNPWDTTFESKPGSKFKINALLEEKSMFSQENEIDFAKILAKDANIPVYLGRIDTLKARKTQVDGELRQILMDFSNSYPALEPQKPDENSEEFQKRHDYWAKEGMRQVAELQKKHEVYVGKLERSVATLNDYIIAIQSSIVSRAATEAKIELGSYDTEKEIFDVIVLDTSSHDTPFYFVGKVGIPLDTAKVMNRSTDGFLATVHYLNYPFVYGTSSLNLAIKDLSLSRKTVPLKLTGEFKQSAQIKSMEGWEAWQARADSLLQGTLKPQNLDYAYAMGKSAANAAVSGGSGSSGSSSGGGLGWRGWTRIAAFTLAAGCGAAAISKQIKADKYNDKSSIVRDKMNNLPENDSKSDAKYTRLYKTYNVYKDMVEESESQRTLYIVGAGAMTAAGILTFVF